MQTKYYSTGTAAERLGVTRDSLLAALKSGAPEPKSPWVGGRRLFSDADIADMRDWYQHRLRARGLIAPESDSAKPSTPLLRWRWTCNVCGVTAVGMRLDSGTPPAPMACLNKSRGCNGVMLPELD